MSVGSHGIKDVITAFVRQAARATGYELIPCWRLNHLPLATHLRDLFARLAIDCVLDVGANRGQYGRFLRQEVGYSGYIASFEPQAACLRDLETNTRGDALWKTFGMALGSTSGQLPINVMRETAFTSFLAPDSTAVPTLAHLNTVVQVEAVQVKRLDEVLPDVRTESGGQNLYLKLDTQGYDLEVLKGGAATLSSVAAMQTEVSVLPIYDGMPDWLTSLRTLKEHFFDVTGIFPVSHDPSLRIVEFDCVAVNTALRRADERATRPTTGAKMAGRSEAGVSRGAPAPTKASGGRYSA